MEDQAKRQCIICNRLTNDYLLIRGCAICQRCEGRIRSSRVMDRHYEFYVQRLKRLWEL